MAIQTLTTPNGAVALLSQQDMQAANNALFVVNCQTPGTAIAYAQLTSYSATANGMFVIANTNAVGGANIYVKRLDLFQTAAVATGTAISFEANVETGVVTGTTAVITRTAVAVGGGTLNAVVQAFNAGAITIPAAVGTRKLVGQGWIPVGVNVVKDNYTMEFGSDAPAAGKTGLTAARATDTARCVGQMGSFVIPPGSTGWLNCWGLGTSTPSFEYNLVLVQI